MLPLRVSVIIPCYKDSATLKDSLDSIYAQTRVVQEVIVINDNSPETEEIEEIIQNYPDVHYYKNEKNLGLAGARNVGVKASTGDVVSFLDADDLFHPKMIETQLSFFDTSVAVSCKTTRFITGDKLLIEPFHSAKVKEVLSPRSILWWNRLTGSSMMIARELLLEFEGYDQSLKSCEDYDLWLRLLAAGVIVREVQSPLYFYRINENGLSRNLVNISFWELVVLRKYFDSYSNYFLQYRKDAFVWFLWLLKHLVRYQRCKKIELRIEIKKNISLMNNYPILKATLKFINKTNILKFFI
jgi:glycosyltransferase involved in cell wall biosynthesis